MQRLLSRTILLTLALGGAALLAPSLAAANPKCGANIRQSVKLTSDMNCPNSYGLVVAKPGITINLNGHTVTGTYGSDFGIDDQGYDRVTIENGTVRNFEDGVFVQYATGTKIEHVKAVGAANFGIAFYDSQHGLIDHSTVSAVSSSYGFYLLNNHSVNVTSSKAIHDEYGFYDDNSFATLDKLTARADTYGVFVNAPLVSFTAKGPRYYTIENSTASNNTYAGFYIEDNYPSGDYQARLVDNTANDDVSFGFYADQDTKGTGNRASGNGTNCWHVPCS